MFKITRILVTDESGGVLKTRHCDITTGDLEQKRSELRRYYQNEFGKKVNINLSYMEGDGDELNSEE